MQRQHRHSSYYAGATLGSAATGLGVATLHTLFLWLILRPTTAMYTPGASRVYLFNFLVVYLLGSVLGVAAMGRLERYQGVPRGGSTAYVAAALLLVLLCNLVFGVTHEALLVVTALLTAVYGYLRTMWAAKGDEAAYSKILLVTVATLAAAAAVGNARVLDDAFAAMDSVLGMRYGGLAPPKALAKWRRENPGRAGYSLGPAWASGDRQGPGVAASISLYQGDWGWGIVLLCALVTYAACGAIEARSRELRLATPSDWERLLDPRRDGEENLMRFFAAAQYEALGQHPTGARNPAALKQFTRSAAFLRNISRAYRSRAAADRAVALHDPLPDLAVYYNGNAYDPFQ